jgi:hypothetical protein
MKLIINLNFWASDLNNGWHWLKKVKKYKVYIKFLNFGEKVFLAEK